MALKRRPTFMWTQKKLVSKNRFATSQHLLKTKKSPDVTLGDSIYYTKFLVLNYLSRLNMKLYAVSDGPPSLAVRMCLKALNIPYELHNVDYIASEHMSEEYAKVRKL